MVAGLLLAAALSPSAPLGAQELAVAELRGRVLLGEAPLPTAQVVLHRVTMGDSGPVDSVRTGMDGGFRFRLPNVPDPSVLEEVWFASVEHAGVSYFGAPIHMTAQLDSLQVLQVYDTTAVPEGGAELPLTARYTLLEQQTGVWYVTDLLQVRNDGDRTLVGPPGGVTWRYPLPQGAGDLEIGGEQMAPDAAELVDGNLSVTSAIPPGAREFVVRYRVPDPFVTLRYPGVTGEAELLVREPAPAIEVDGLVSAQPVQMEAGVSYRRFFGGQLVDALVSVREAAAPPELPLRGLAVGVALLLTAATVFAVLRPHPSIVLASSSVAAAAADARLSPFERRQLLLLEVARLDDARPHGADADEWSARRRALISRARELGSSQR